MKTISAYVADYTKAVCKNPANTIHESLAPVILQAIQDQHAKTWAMCSSKALSCLQERIGTYTAKHNNENPTEQTAKELRWGIEVLRFAQSCLEQLPCPPLKMEE